MADTARTCGSCTLCCKVMGVVELAKPAGTWCTHCAIGRGCQTYTTRPETCRAFECLWLQGLLGDEDKPNATHIVWATTTDGQSPIGHVDPHYPRAHTTRRVRALVNVMHNAGLPVIFAIGTAREMHKPDGTVWRFNEGDTVPQVAHG